MKIFSIFFMGLLITGWSLGKLKEELEPLSLCTWTRCPYYEAPDEECRTYTELIPKKMIPQTITDTDEGLILARQCKDEISFK